MLPPKLITIRYKDKILQQETPQLLCSRHIEFIYCFETEQDAFFGGENGILSVYKTAILSSQKIRMSLFGRQKPLRERSALAQYF